MLSMVIDQINFHMEDITDNDESIAVSFIHPKTKKNVKQIKPFLSGLSYALKSKKEWFQ